MTVRRWVTKSLELPPVHWLCLGWEGCSCSFLSVTALMILDCPLLGTAETTQTGLFASPGLAHSQNPFLSISFFQGERRNRTKEARLRRAKGKGEEEDTWFLLLFCFSCVQVLSRRHGMDMLSLSPFLLSPTQEGFELNHNKAN